MFFEGVILDLYYNGVTIPDIFMSFRSSPSEVFLGKGVLKMCSKFTREHPCRSAISVKLQSMSITL